MRIYFFFLQNKHFQSLKLNQQNFAKITFQTILSIFFNPMKFFFRQTAQIKLSFILTNKEFFKVDLHLRHSLFTFFSFCAIRILFILKINSSLGYILLLTSRYEVIYERFFNGQDPS
jgi:ABC-type uncharacterized transport system permease subunit